MAESIRIERDICDQTRAQFEACTHPAYIDYKTAAVETCGNKLIGECNTEEEVNANKDHQLTGILVQLQSSVREWDNDKCPAVKAHIDRLKGEEVSEVEAAQHKRPESEAVPTTAEVVSAEAIDMEAANGTPSFTMCFFLLVLSFTTLLW